MNFSVSSNDDDDDEEEEEEDEEDEEDEEEEGRLRVSWYVRGVYPAMICLLFPVRGKTGTGPRRHRVFDQPAEDGLRFENEEEIITALTDKRTKHRRKINERKNRRH